MKVGEVGVGGGIRILVQSNIESTSSSFKDIYAFFLENCQMKSHRHLNQIFWKWVLDSQLSR